MVGFICFFFLKLAKLSKPNKATYRLIKIIKYSKKKIVENFIYKAKPKYVKNH